MRTDTPLRFPRWVRATWSSFADEHLLFLMHVCAVSSCCCKIFKISFSLCHNQPQQINDFLVIYDISVRIFCHGLRNYVISKLVLVWCLLLALLLVLTSTTAGRVVRTTNRLSIPVRSCVEPVRDYLVLTILSYPYDYYVKHLRLHCHLPSGQFAVISRYVLTFIM